MAPTLVEHRADAERWARSKGGAREVWGAFAFKGSSQEKTQKHSEWLEHTRRLTVKVNP